MRYSKKAVQAMPNKELLDTFENVLIKMGESGVPTRAQEQNVRTFRAEIDARISPVRNYD